MGFNNKLMKAGLVLTLFFNMKFATAMIDPDSGVLAVLQNSCSSQAIAGANVATLQNMLAVLNSANTFYSNPANTTDLSAIATLITQVNTAIAAAQAGTTGGTTGGTTDPQAATKNAFTAIFSDAVNPGALNAIINNPTYNSVNYLVDTPSATNSVFTRIQSFFTNNVPNVTGTALNDLKTLLSNANLNKFLQPGVQQSSAATLLTAVNTAIASTQKTTPTVSVDQQVVNAVNAAVKQTTFDKAIAALNAIITTYGNNTVSSSTQTAFANAIMIVGGNLYLLYSKQVQSAAKKYTITAADKTLAKQWVAATKAAYPLTPFKALLKASLSSNLLTGPQTTSGTQKNYVAQSLVPAFANTNSLNAMIAAVGKIK